ncbi:MAG: DegT/DnrJ/EryC1/StrS family aminotransferase [Candidatus Saccharimonadia bacterium]
MNARRYLNLVANIGGYRNPKPLARLKTELDTRYFAKNFTPHQWFLTVNGRTALYLLLESLNLESGSEVLVQSFTCVTAVNPIIWAGLTPIFVDIDTKTLSAATQSLSERVSAKTRVIVLQHSFGIPGASKAVKEIAAKHNLIIVEDCAHSLGVHDQANPLGTMGDAAIFSFGIEKSLQSKFGGALLVSSPDLVKNIETMYRKLPELSRTQTFLWLLYPPLRQLIRKSPDWLGRILRRILELSGILKAAISRSELRGKYPKGTPSTMPGVAATIILESLKTLDSTLAHRQELTKFYGEWLANNHHLVLPGPANLPLLKYPIICESEKLRSLIVAALKSKDIYVTDWYRPALYPADTNFEAIGYNPASCPQAESIAERILNLPTGPEIDLSHATIAANVINHATAILSG